MLGIEGGLQNLAMRVLPNVGVDELAATLLDTAINGGKLQMLENKHLAARGKELLNAAK